MLGVLLIDKPAGLTSHDIVARLRRILGTKRIGHAGTLDPIATGLLVMAVGPATRFLQYLSLEPKVYEATFQFGAETDTYDCEGEAHSHREVPSDLAARIEEKLPSFIGEIAQLPPMFSAVKKAGQPLYKYAREGVEVERTERAVFIDKFELAATTGTTAKFTIVCSGGTYVRTLAHDLGQLIGCGAYVQELRRTQVGVFHIDDAMDWESASAEKVIPLAEAIYPMEKVALNEVQVEHVRQGRQIQIADRQAGKIALVDETGQIVGVGTATGNRVQPDCVLPVEANGAVV